MTTERTRVQSNPTVLCNWRIVFGISDVKSHIDLQFRFYYPRFGSRRTLEYKSGSFRHLLTRGNLPQEYLNCTQNQLKDVEIDDETPSWIRTVPPRWELLPWKHMIDSNFKREKQRSRARVIDSRCKWPIRMQTFS